MIKKCTIYYSLKNNDWIVVSNNKNIAGIYYEGNIYYHGKNNIEAIMKAIAAFHNSSIIDRNLRDYKKTDWPAFIESGAKTIKYFEKEYLPISIEGQNESNTICNCIIYQDNNSNNSINDRINIDDSIENIKNKIMKLIENKK